MKQQNNASPYWAMVNMLKLRREPEEELRTRLEISGITFNTRKCFEEFKRKRLSIITTCENIKVAYLDKGTETEMLLGWWH